MRTIVCIASESKKIIMRTVVCIASESKSPVHCCKGNIYTEQVKIVGHCISGQENYPWY